ncbi:MAG: helix-turn-helix transcriptional regulator [Candidatus Riesia sp.]|nr:helix-turn-helix transcriptional regulator [Candidatus Riesia sp.]
MNFDVDNWSGNDLKEFRQKLGLRRAKFCKRIDYTPTHILNVENNDLELSNKLIRQIKREFFTTQIDEKKCFQIDKE